MSEIAPEILKQLKVKTGVVTRINKEVLSYRKEETAQKAKIQKMKDNEACTHDIKQQDEVLNECLTCHAQAEKRLDTAVQELDAFIKTKFKEFLGNVDNTETEGVAADVRKAEIVINDAIDTVPSITLQAVEESEDEDDI